MADKYINELTQLSGTPSGTVVLPVFDGDTKQITVTDLMSAGLQLGTAGTQASPGTHLHEGVYAGTALAGTASAGLAPALSGVSSEYLNGAGAWSTPAGGTAGGAPTDAQYLTMALNSSLTAERVLGSGTAITLVDGGAGATVSVNVNLGTAATQAAPGTHLHSGVYSTTTVATDTIFDAAGDLAVGTASNKSARLAVGGTAGMKLVTAPAQAKKMAWIPDRFSIGFSIGDGTGTATVPNATYGPIEAPFAGTITAARLFSDANGTASLTFRKLTYSTYTGAPGTANNISGTVPIVLAGTNKAENTTLTSWTTGFSAGDLLFAVVANAGTIKAINASLTGFKADVA